MYIGKICADIGRRDISINIYGAYWAGRRAGLVPAQYTPYISKNGNSTFFKIRDDSCFSYQKSGLPVQRHLERCLSAIGANEQRVQAVGQHRPVQCGLFLCCHALFQHQPARGIEYQRRRTGALSTSSGGVNTLTQPSVGFGYTDTRSAQSGMSVPTRLSTTNGGYRSAALGIGHDQRVGTRAHAHQVFRGGHCLAVAFPFVGIARLAAAGADQYFSNPLAAYVVGQFVHRHCNRHQYVAK